MMNITEGMALVKQECCNLISGVCIGMTTRGTLFRAQGKCWIAEHKQCRYHDVNIHPLIAKQKERKGRWKK